MLNRVSTLHRGWARRTRAVWRLPREPSRVSPSWIKQTEEPAMQPLRSLTINLRPRRVTPKAISQLSRSGSQACRTSGWPAPFRCPKTAGSTKLLSSKRSPRRKLK